MAFGSCFRRCAARGASGHLPGRQSPDQPLRACRRTRTASALRESPSRWSGPPLVIIRGGPVPQPAGQAFLAPSPGPLVGQSQDERGDTRQRQPAHNQPSANTWVSGPRHPHCWHPPWTIRGRSRTVKARPLSGGGLRRRTPHSDLGPRRRRRSHRRANRGREGGGLCVVRVGDGRGQNHRYGKVPHEGDSLPSQSPLVSNGCRNSRFDQASPVRRHPPPGRSSKSRHLHAWAHNR